jgi:hypothetical protein
MNPLVLSKSRFLAGLQCPLRLWYRCHEPDRASEPSALQKALMETGRRVGELARARYPGGVLIDGDVSFSDAVEATKQAIDDLGREAVFEGAFSFEDVRIRVDILQRSGRSSWNLIEVKSGTSVKDEHVYDLAVQYHVLSGLGLTIRHAGILSLNNEYVYDGEHLDLEALFRFTDLKEQAIGRQEEVRDRINAIKAILSDVTPPTVDPSRHCQRPYACEFYDHCRRRMPDHWVLELLGIRQDRLDELAAVGIVDIQDVPESLDLSMIQARIRDCVVHNTEHIGEGLGRTLRQYAYPIHFLDFEAVAPAIPRYADTRPYQTLPFQWSDHVLADDGRLSHRGYLCQEDRDPREEIARTVLESLEEGGTICTYTTFENQVIAGLADHLPPYRERLRALLGRFRDLHEAIRKEYYHPEFHGSFSIKSVLPVLVPSMSYRDLFIREGGQAAMAYLRMIDPETPAEEKARIREDLWEYCRQDTLAMVKIREELLRRCGG